MKIFTIKIGKKIYKKEGLNMANAILSDLLRIDMKPNSEVIVHIRREDSNWEPWRKKK